MKDGLFADIFWQWCHYHYCEKLSSLPSTAGFYECSIQTLNSHRWKYLSNNGKEMFGNGKLALSKGIIFLPVSVLLAVEVNKHNPNQYVCMYIIQYNIVYMSWSLVPQLNNEKFHCHHNIKKMHNILEK